MDEKFKYVFWVDADVTFTNKNWLVDGVKELQSGAVLIQPFEYCIHLEKDQNAPAFNPDYYRDTISDPIRRKENMWRSFCANFVTTNISNSINYNKHGHVGFALGACRHILELCPLYDRALIGGADHIILHAAAGHIPHECITKSFKDDLENVLAWSKKFYSEIRGRIGYVKGDLYHIWHGDISKRQYLKRIQDFTIKTKQIKEKDENGLYITNNRDDRYMQNYFMQREIVGNDFLQSVAVDYIENSLNDQNYQNDDSIPENYIAPPCNDNGGCQGECGGGDSGPDPSSENFS